MKVKVKVKVKKYLEIVKISFKNQLAWRFDVVMNIVFTVARILFAYLLWGAIFGQRDMVAGFTFSSMLSYYIVNSFLTQMDKSHTVSEELQDRIRNGTFSKYMIIPVRVEGYFMAQAVGKTAFYGVFTLIAAVAGAFLFGIRFVFTQSPPMLAAAAALAVLGFIFLIQLNFFLGILTFRYEDIWLFLMIKSNLIAFITGAMVPLSLLPEGVLGVMRYFPFYYIGYLPSMLVIGQNAGEAGIGLLVLTGWVVFFGIINPLLYKQIRTRYDGVGI